MEKKTKKRLIKAGIYTGLFSLGIGVTYLAVPRKVNQTLIINEVGDYPGGGNKSSFLSKLMADLQNDGLSASIGLELAFGDKDENGEDIHKLSLYSDDLFVYMPSMEELSIALNSIIDYNGYTMGLGLNYADTNLYLSIGQKMKKNSGATPSSLATSSYTVKEAIDVKYRIIDVDWDEIVLTLEDILGEEALYGSDSSLIDSLMKSDMSALQIDIDGKTSKGGDRYKLSLALKEGEDPATIYLNALPNEGGLESVEASNLDLGGIRINSLKLTTQEAKNVKEKIASLVPSDAESYVPLVNTMGLVREMYDIVKAKKFSILADGTFKNKYKTTKENGGVSEAPSIATGPISWPTGSTSTPDDMIVLKAEESIDLKADAYIDLENSLYNVEASASYTDENNVVSKKGLALNSIPSSQSDENNKRNDFLLTFNDFKYGMSYLAVDELLASIKGDAEESLDLSSIDIEALSKVLDILSSDGIKAVKEGRYVDLLDYITYLKNDTNGLKANISLKGFGLGDNSNVLLDVRSENDINTIKVAISNVCLGDATIDLNLALEPYPEEKVISFSEEELNEYVFIEGLPNVVKQIKSIVKNPQLAISFAGSVMNKDDSSIGLGIEGNTAFDANKEVKSGVGKIEFTEIGTKIKDNNNHQVDKKHQVKIDVDKEKMLFHYDSNQSSGLIKDDEGINGKMSIDSLNAIIEDVFSLVGSNDHRFTKFFSSLQSTATSTLLTDLLAGRFSSLTRKQILLDMKLNEVDGSEHRIASSSSFVLSGEALGLDKDNNGVSQNLTIKISYNEIGEISRISIENLYASGKIINFDLNLLEYQDSLRKAQLKEDSSYMDFSSIHTLIGNLLNTAKMDNFHIAGKLNLKLGSLNTPLNADIEADIRVQESKTYARIQILKFPLIPKVNTGLLGAGSRNIYAYYAPGITGDDEHPSHMYLRTVDDPLIGRTKTNDSCYAGSYFSDINHILDFILSKMLGLNEDTVGNLLNGDSSSNEPKEFENIFTSPSEGFVFNGNEEGDHSWDLSIRLGKLLGTSLLGDLSANIGANGNGTFSSLNVKLPILSILTVNLPVSLDGTEISSSNRNDYNSFISSYSGSVVA